MTPVFVFSSSSPDKSCFADNFAKINAFREYPLLSIEKVDTFANYINLRPMSFERGHRLRGESPIKSSTSIKSDTGVPSFVRFVQCVALLALRATEVVGHSFNGG